MLLSIVIPVYNGEESITSLYERICKTFCNKYSFEVIYVFDSGKEGVWSYLKELKEKNADKIQIFHLSGNVGQHKAIQFGISKAKGDFIITMDEDLQHNPADIIKMIDKQKEGNYDVVYGYYSESNNSFIRDVISSIIKLTLIGSIKGLHKRFSPFRLIKIKTALQLKDNNNRYYFIDSIIGEVTENVTDIVVTHYKSIKKESGYTWFKLMNHLLSIIADYTKIAKEIFYGSLILIFFSVSLFLLSSIVHSFEGIFKWAILLGITGMVLFILSAILYAVKFRNHKSDDNPVNYTTEFL